MGRLTDQLKQQRGGRLTAPPPVAEPEEGRFETTARELKEIGTGMLRGLGSTLTGLGQLTLKGASYLPLPKGIKESIRGGIETGEELKETILRPKTFPEKVGFLGEQIGEFLIPVGAGKISAKALKSIFPKIEKAPTLVKGITKLSTRGAVTGAEFGGKTVLQTGGNWEEAKKAALIGAVTPFAEAPIKATFKGVTKVLPKKLYSQIFKTAKDDLMNFYRTLAKEKPINPTLAEEVLERGLSGSSKNMAIYSIKKLDTLEAGVDALIKQKNLIGATINITNKKGYIGILNTVKDQFKQGFLSHRSNEAETLIKKLKVIKGNAIPLDIGLRLRRFIDRMRNTSSFRIDPKLTPRQEEFKTATNDLRKKLADAGLKDLMNEERVFIEAIDNIVADAVRRDNRRLLSLTDVLLGGGGLASGVPGAGLGAMAGVRAFQRPYTLTGLGQILFRSGNAIESLIPFLEAIETRPIVPVTTLPSMIKTER
jgi:hypothetical protein